tara:strand:+ start:98355 stop:98456 length:102 start_codon:yes stop_codon:yes gene_type:complete
MEIFSGKTGTLWRVLQNLATNLTFLERRTILSI